MENIQRTIIENYIQSYNAFDVEGMTKDLHEDVEFENIANGKADLKTQGLEDFKKQAIAATSYFKERKQTISSWDFQGDHVAINIDYRGVLAIDLPNNLKAGDLVELKGQSHFDFAGEKIVKIQDRS